MIQLPDNSIIIGYASKRGVDYFADPVAPLSNGNSNYFQDLPTNLYYHIKYVKSGVFQGIYLLGYTSISASGTFKLYHYNIDGTIGDGLLFQKIFFI